MSARDDIENLMTLYTEALDEARFADLGELFADGTVTIEGGPHSGRVARGRSEVAGFYQSIVALDAGARTGTRHFITNIYVQAEGDEARARSYFAVTQQTSTLPLQIVACGAYHDLYRKHRGHWVFADRLIVCDQVGNLQEHML